MELVELQQRALLQPANADTCANSPRQDLSMRGASEDQEGRDLREARLRGAPLPYPTESTPLPSYIDLCRFRCLLRCLGAVVVQRLVLPALPCLPVV
jgi:hypothetical protein